MKVKELANGTVVELTTLEAILSFVLEDFVEISLQFFYFEKYQFVTDTFAYANAGFMVVKGFELTFRVVIALKYLISRRESF